MNAVVLNVSNVTFLLRNKKLFSECDILFFSDFEVHMSIKKLSFWLISVVIFLVSIYGGFLFIISWPINDFSISNAGVFGDSFGVLTSLFSGLAFAGLIITILMQREELQLQREEISLTRGELSGQKKEMQKQNEYLNIQRFENTFFKMIELLDLCRKDINFREAYGRDAIRNLYKSLIEEYFHKTSWPDGRTHRVFKESCKTKEGVSTAYKDFYEMSGDELGQYYRTMFNVLKLVDSADFLPNKKIYTNLLRAQLSRYELLLLLFNCISSYGDGKMAPLVIKFDLLKHLESELIPSENRNIYSVWKQGVSAI